VLVILTAAVTPHPDFAVALSDPSTRSAQYRLTAAKWGEIADNVGGKLVIIETTGADPQQVLPRGSCAELVAYSPQPDDIKRGKGAVEARALDDYLEHAAMPPETTFYKCTGRIWIHNAPRLVQPLKVGEIAIRRRIDGLWADTRFFGTTLEVWRRHLTGMADQVYDDEDVHLEHVMARRLLLGLGHDELKVRRLPAHPEWEGMSGTSGVAYRTRRTSLGSRIRNGLEDEMSRRVGRWTL